MGSGGLGRGTGVALDERLCFHNNKITPASSYKARPTASPSRLPFLPALLTPRPLQPFALPFSMQAARTSISSTSTTNRLRAKTSELSDLLRRRDPSPPPPPGPDSSMSDPATSLGGASHKTKRRIPFLGLRKKVGTCVFLFFFFFSCASRVHGCF
jgi:hypothetical protein